MAWPRIKNSRSSAQPGTHPHNGVQATVTPAPDAEPLPGTGQNTGVSGTTHAVAYDYGGYGPATESPAADRPWAGRRLRPIRYAHSAADETAEPAYPAAESDTEPPGTVLSGTVVHGPAPVGEEPEAYEDTAGPVYESPRPAYTEPPGAVPFDEPAEPVPNEGLGIFGDVATTEVPDDTRTKDAGRRPGPEPTRVIPIGATWNQPITPPPTASDAADEDRKAHPFERMRGMRWAVPPGDEHEPRVSVRDLPPDVQLRFWRLRLIIMVIVGVVFAVLTKSWEISLTLAILAGIVDTIYRSRNAAAYVSGGSHPGARKRTNKQLDRMRREGYFALDARPIPNSREFIDHLVVGPTGVYAIDSEKWDPKLPIRTWNGKKLYHGPESQKDRLEHAVWEAAQASEILSKALGTEIEVRPALAIYGPKIPWDIATIRNVDVFTGPALRKYLKRRGRMKDGVVRLTREEVRTIYDTASRMLPDVTASSSRTYTPVG
ncbi:MAG: NERD domain-containing protein [Trebonia sp.]